MKPPRTSTARAALRIQMPAAQQAQGDEDIDDLEGGDEQLATQGPGDHASKWERSGSGLLTGETSFDACPELLQDGHQPMLVGIVEQDHASLLLQQKRHMGAKVGEGAAVRGD